MYLPERPRRLRRNETLRRMTRETQLSVDDMIMPLFIREEARAKTPIASMPGQFQLGIEDASEMAAKIYDAGIPAVLLFGIPEKKDALGSGAYDRTAYLLHCGSHQIKGLECALCRCVPVWYTDHTNCGALRKLTA